jgi:hypothetical protein
MWALCSCFMKPQIDFCVRPGYIYITLHTVNWDHADYFLQYAKRTLTAYERTEKKIEEDEEIVLKTYAI